MAPQYLPCTVSKPYKYKYSQLSSSGLLTEFTSSISYSHNPIYTSLFVPFSLHLELHIMGIRILSMVSSGKQIRKLQSLISSSEKADVPKGDIAVYVGETQPKRFLVPISVVNHPSFKDLLKRAEEEFGFDHPMGRLNIPCKVDAFKHLTSQLHH
ncbi:hypothetical protein PTKIN_Ptkin02bG0206500 [Pterospermum kingtungense]